MISRKDLKSGSSPSSDIGIDNALITIVDKRKEATMQIFPKRHNKAFVQKEVSVVMKKAYCGFEDLEKKHDEKIRALLEGVRGRRLRAQVA